MVSRHWQRVDASVLRPLIDAVRAPQWKATLILLSSTILMLAWRYVASPECLAPWCATGGGDGRVAAAVGSFVGCFVLLGVVPALIVTLVLRERLAIKAFAATSAYDAAISSFMSSSTAA